MMLKSLVPAVLLSTAIHAASPTSIMPPIFLGLIGFETSATLVWTFRTRYFYELGKGKESETQ
jgi:hypothetical protein